MKKILLSLTLLSFPLTTAWGMKGDMSSPSSSLTDASPPIRVVRTLPAEVLALPEDELTRDVSDEVAKKTVIDTGIPGFSLKIKNSTNLKVSLTSECSLERALNFIVPRLISSIREPILKKTYAIPPLNDGLLSQTTHVYERSNEREAQEIIDFLVKKMNGPEKISSWKGEKRVTGDQEVLYRIMIMAQEEEKDLSTYTLVLRTYSSILGEPSVPGYLKHEYEDDWKSFSPLLKDAKNFHANPLGAALLTVKGESCFRTTARIL